MHKRILPVAALILAGMIAAPPMATAGPVVGSPLAITVDDSPLGNSFTQTITVGDGTTTLQDDLTLTQTIVPVAPGVTWLVFDYEATGGHLLAGNPNAYWTMGATYSLSTPAYLTGGYFYWSVNGVATEPISPFLGLPVLGPDPLDPSVGQVYGGYNSPSGKPVTTVDQDLFVTPYSAISQGGMNPSAVTGFVFAYQITDAAVPEPSSMILGAMAAAMLGGSTWIRGRRRCRAM